MAVKICLNLDLGKNNISAIMSKIKFTFLMYFEEYLLELTLASLIKLHNYKSLHDVFNIEKLLSVNPVMTILSC